MTRPIDGHLPAWSAPGPRPGAFNRNPMAPARRPRPVRFERVEMPARGDPDYTGPVWWDARGNLFHDVDLSEAVAWGEGRLAIVCVVDPNAEDDDDDDPL